MQHSRRQFMTGATSFALSYGLITRLGISQEMTGTRVILLGTKGGPRVGESGRSNPSTLVLINNVPYIVDCGYGTSRWLLAAGVPLHRLRYIFITHHHSDHNLEYGTLFYNTWITGFACSRGCLRSDRTGENDPGFLQLHEIRYRYTHRGRRPARPVQADFRS